MEAPSSVLTLRTKDDDSSGGSDAVLRALAGRRGLAPSAAAAAALDGTDANLLQRALSVCTPPPPPATPPAAPCRPTQRASPRKPWDGCHARAPALPLAAPEPPFDRSTAYSARGGQPPPPSPSASSRSGRRGAEGAAATGAVSGPPGRRMHGDGGCGAQRGAGHSGGAAGGGAGGLAACGGSGGSAAAAGGAASADPLSGRTSPGASSTVVSVHSVNSSQSSVSGGSRISWAGRSDSASRSRPLPSAFSLDSRAAAAVYRCRQSTEDGTDCAVAGNLVIAPASFAGNGVRYVSRESSDAAAAAGVAAGGAAGRRGSARHGGVRVVRQWPAAIPAGLSVGATVYGGAGEDARAAAAGGGGGGGGGPGFARATAGRATAGRAAAVRTAGSNADSPPPPTKISETSSYLPQQLSSSRFSGLTLLGPSESGRVGLLATACDDFDLDDVDAVEDRLLLIERPPSRTATGAFELERVDSEDFLMRSVASVNLEAIMRDLAAASRWSGSLAQQRSRDTGAGAGAGAGAGSGAPVCDGACGARAGSSPQRSESGGSSGGGAGSGRSQPQLPPETLGACERAARVLTAELAKSLAVFEAAQQKHRGAFIMPPPLRDSIVSLLQGLESAQRVLGAGEAAGAAGMHPQDAPAPHAAGETPRGVSAPGAVRAVSAHAAWPDTAAAAAAAVTPPATRRAASRPAPTPPPSFAAAKSGPRSSTKTSPKLGPKNPPLPLGGRGGRGGGRPPAPLARAASATPPAAATAAPPAPPAAAAGFSPGTPPSSPSIASRLKKAPSLGRKAPQWPSAPFLYRGASAMPVKKPPLRPQYPRPQRSSEEDAGLLAQQRTLVRTRSGDRPR